MTVRPSERYYVRHHQSGQLGWLETHNGKEHVRLDRPRDPNNLVPYRQKEWLPEKSLPPLNAYGLAQIQFAADVQLCKSQGMHKLGKRTWLNLKDEERIKWTNEGPDPERWPTRARLFRAIKIALEPLTGE